MLKFPFKRGSLARQKVKRRKKKKSWWRAKAPVAFFLTGLALSTFYLTSPLKQEAIKTKEAPSHKVKPSWELVIRSNLQDTNKEKIIRELPKIIEEAQTKKDVAEKIQKYFSFAKTTLLQIAPGKLLVDVTDRIPEFSILADKPRLVSIDSEVYGELSPKYRMLPKLENLLKKRKNYTFSANSALILDEEEKTRLEEARMILHLAEKSSLEVDRLSFVEYRGFKLNFRHERTEVFLGRQPFKKKFTKLMQIQKQLKNDGNARRIELDYDGKAFIKTLKAGDNVDS